MNTEQKEALLARLRKEQETGNKDTGGGERKKTNYFKPEPDTTTTVRFLPSANEEDDPWEKTSSHWGMGPTGRERISCSRQHKSPSPCYTCARVAELRKEEDEDSKAFVDKFYAKTRYYFQLWNYDEEKFMVWEAPISVYNQVTGYLTNNKYGFDIFSMEEGFDFDVIRVGSDKYDTAYTLQSVPGAKGPVLGSKEDMDNLKKDLVSFSSFLKEDVYSDEVVEAFMNGSDSPREYRERNREQKSNGSVEKKKR